MKYYVETFGCQMNVADSQEMGRHLISRGFLPTEKPEEANVILVNTCTVRQHAEDKALSYLGTLVPWKSTDKDRCLVVTGCAAERLQDRIRHRFPYVNLVVGAKSIARFDDLIETHLPSLSFDSKKELKDVWGTPTNYGFTLPEEKTSASVTIMRGCNYSCSYCIVPSVRGREIYRSAESILSEVRQKAQLGLGEVMLLGQTVNSYKPSLPNPDENGKDVTDFADLLRLINRVPGVKRIRFMSPHPYYMNDRMIDAMADCENVCHHMHLPVQSGSNRILKKMKRNYTRELFLDRVCRLKQSIPRIPITTDFIVGFPDETESDFEETLSLVKEVGFDSAYCFKYSPRPGTESAEWEDNVPHEVKQERLAKLLDLTEALSREKARNLIGAHQEVLVEKVNKEEQGDIFEGRTRSSRKMFFISQKTHRIGDLVNTVVEKASGRSWQGRALVY